ncbi:MAG TPA: Asp23/Gls24 family envelope stress response protein [Clostridiaceae bacterium]|nr:Asp23/Gls24 family envelope stress response protein [Clostridiaceae bacterium]
MPEKNDVLKDQDDIGEIRISADVITVIAHTVASEIEGVAGMNANIAENISSVLGRKNPTKGVKVEIDGKDVTIDFYILVEYGARIPEVAWRIQEKVKSTVESMTGMNVTAINIHVQGISFDKLKEDKKYDESAKT